jgi:hypothetical protein
MKNLTPFLLNFFSNLLSRPGTASASISDLQQLGFGVLSLTNVNILGPKYWLIGIKFPKICKLGKYLVPKILKVHG